MSELEPMRTFVAAMTRLVDEHHRNEAKILDVGAGLLHDLVCTNEWLPDEFATPSRDRYQQYLLYGDPQERFSVVSFVWLPTQRTPIHDHMTWGLIGQMRGEELCEEYDVTAPGAPKVQKNAHRMRRGDIDRVSPRIGDIHAVSHGGTAGAAISIHVYGADIGTVRRHVFEPATGTITEFVSGYDNVLAQERGRGQT